MTNTEDPDQLASSDLDLQYLRRQGMSFSAREGLSVFFRLVLHYIFLVLYKNKKQKQKQKQKKKKKKKQQQKTTFWGYSLEAPNKL